MPRKDAAARAAYNAEYRRKNAAVLVEKVAEWRRKNPDALAAQRAKNRAKEVGAVRVRDRKKMAMYSAKWKALNPERAKEIQRRHDLKRHYKITAAEYEALLKKQGGVCAICKHPEPKRRLCVDHDHATTKARGLLCTGCNTMLGGAQDTTALLLAGADYLIEHGSQPGMTEAA